MAVTAAGWVVLVTRRLRRFQISTTSETPPLSALAVILTFLIILGVIHGLHFRYFTVSVVLYSAIFDVFLAAFATFLAIKTRKLGRRLERFEIAQTLAICVLLGYGFAITMPTVIDRSLSIYFLEKLHERGGALPVEAMADLFIHEYIDEYRLIDVRLTEQTQSGTVRVDGDCVILTARGVLIAKFTHLYRRMLLPRNRDLMGDVTDSLTDPFRNSPPPSTNRCNER